MCGCECDGSAVLLEGGEELGHVEEAVALLPRLNRPRQALPARHLQQLQPHACPLQGENRTNHTLVTNIGEIQIIYSSYIRNFFHYSGNSLWRKNKFCIQTMKKLLMLSLFYWMHLYLNSSKFQFIFNNAYISTKFYKCVVLCHY